MKPTMIFTIVMMIIIILMTAFDVHFGANVPLDVAPDKMAHTLFVCPVEQGGIWAIFSTMLKRATKPITIGFSFAILMLMFSWGWALYQNLLKDKFSRDVYKNPWAFTKMTFWALVAVLLAAATPTYFRTVKVEGSNEKWVLCENNSPRAVAVPAEKVHP